MKIANLYKGLVGNWDFNFDSISENDNGIAYYKFDGNAEDSSGSNDGTVIQGSFSDGIFTQAFQTNQIGDAIQLPPLLEVNTTNIWCISLWFYYIFNGIGTNYGRILVNDGILIYNSFDHTLNFIIGGELIETGLLLHPTYTNKWSHLVIVKDLQNIKIYFNDTLIVDTSIIISPEATSVVYIGNDSTLTRTFEGSIDELKIYDRVLVDAEVNLLFTKNRLPKSFQDKSVNKNVLVNNGATFTDNQYGEENSAILFDGIEDYLSLGTVYNDLTNNFTLCAWIKPNLNSTINGRIISRRKAPTQWDWYLVNSDSVGDLAFYDGSTVFRSNSGGISDLNDGEWHFVSVILDGGNSRFYADGVLGSSTFSPSIQQTNTETYIGISFPGGVSFDGSMESVRIFNRALSEQEVKKLYETKK